MRPGLLSQELLSSQQAEVCTVQMLWRKRVVIGTTVSNMCFYSDWYVRQTTLHRDAQCKIGCSIGQRQLHVANVDEHAAKN